MRLLGACALDFTSNWDEHLHLVEFAYNNVWNVFLNDVVLNFLYVHARLKVLNYMHIFKYFMSISNGPRLEISKGGSLHVPFS